MPGLGVLNPCPMMVGGGPSPIELVYVALRNAVGEGGSAADEHTTIDAAWRQAKARGLGAVSTYAERAALQAFPDHATDALGYYERFLGIVRDPASSDDERRQAVTIAYTRQILSAIPDINLGLAAIDSRLSVILAPFESLHVTEQGRAFQDLAATLPFGGGRKSTFFPNFSNAFRAHLLFDIGAGVVPGPAELLVMRQALALLYEVLTAWNDVSIFTSHDGFNLGIDLLGLTPL